MIPDEQKCNPFLKWAGGKMKLVNTITKHFPTVINNYFEPFVGAGAISLNVCANKIYISDTNKDLILVWQMIRDFPEDLIREVRLLFSPENLPEIAYYSLRKEFNTKPEPLRRAALFIYLNRHGFNGMCRYNSTGDFNIPCGKYKKTPGFDADHVRKISLKIKNWKIARREFENVLRRLECGDVAYCDPPYVGENRTKEGTGFTAYAPGDFSIEQHIQLADEAKAASLRGAVVVISNHHTGFTEKIYSERGAIIEPNIQVTRTIASKAENRRKATELIAIFTPLNV